MGVKGKVGRMLFGEDGDRGRKEAGAPLSPHTHTQSDRGDGGDGLRLLGCTGGEASES